MLRAEYEGVKAMSETGTIQVPTPIAFGEFEKTGQGFALFEYLNFCGGGSQFELGVHLAKMHRATSEKGFGFHIDNTIGATPQPNLPWIGLVLGLVPPGSSLLRAQRRSPPDHQ